MSEIIKANAGNLIIKKENETYFFNHKKGENLKIKQQFITTDGYEQGIEFDLEEKEIREVAKLLEEIVREMDDKDFVAIGENLQSEIHFKAKDLRTAEQWVAKNIGWDADVLTLEQFEKNQPICCENCRQEIGSEDVLLEQTNNGSGQLFTLIEIKCSCGKMNKKKGVWGHTNDRKKAFQEIKGC